MNCPHCRRTYSDDSVFPITCSCRTRFGKDGKIVSSRRGNTPPVRVAKREPASTKEPVGTMMASIIPKWALSFKGGCSCRDWELKMNRWGISGCEEHRQEIIDHLSKQTDQLIPPFSVAPKMVRDVVAGKMLDLAIKKAKTVE